MGETGAAESSETHQAHATGAQEAAQMEVDASANDASASAESVAASEPMEVDSQVEERSDGADALQTRRHAREGNGGDEETKEGEQVVVNLKFLHRERVTLTCSSTLRVDKLKQRVREAYIDAVRQDQANSEDGQVQSEHEPVTQPLRLIYKGKVLKDDQTLESAQFASEDTIHAVFSRPPLTPPNAPPAVSLDPGQAPSSQATSSQTSNNGNSDDGDERSLFVFNLPDAAPSVPDISRLITNIVSSAMNASDDGGGTAATIRIIPMSPPSGSVTTTASAETTSVSASATSILAATTAQASTAPSTTHTTSAASVATPSDVHSTPAPSTTPSTRANQTGGAASSHTGSSGLLNQAAALRRSIPALELTPLSRPPELSTEMYNLGNAVRESGDTYLAIHRQLQFLSTRFLQENNLSAAERARLRARVQQLIPVMQRAANLSTVVAEQLSSSSYGGPHMTAPPPASDSGNGSHTLPQRPSGSTPGDATAQAFRAFADIFQRAQGVDQSAATNTTNQVMSAIPNILSVVSALAAGTRGDSQTAGVPMAPMGSSDELAPIRSLSAKLQALTSSRFDEATSLPEQLQRAVFSLIAAHVSECCGGGIDRFTRSCVEETEIALQQCLEAEQIAYVRHESRCSILRLAFQDLGQLCSPHGGDVEARVVKIRMWLRRSCSHLFAELCEVVPASRAVQLVGALMTNLLNGVNATSAQPSPLAQLFSALATEFLRHRFTLN